MTIGWGAACVDGIVIAADSLVSRYVKWPDGAEDLWAEKSTAKVRWLGDRLAFVLSGAFDNLARDPDFSGVPIEEAAARIFFEMHEHRVVVPQLNRLVGTDVLIGGGPRGERPELLLMQSLDTPAGVRHQWIPVGSTVETGAMGFVAPGQRKLDTVARVGDGLTTDVALGLGISACHAYVRELYRGFGRTRLGEFRGVLGPGEGEIPPVAFPLQIAVITAHDVRRYEVRLPDDITPEDEAAARAPAAASS